MMVVFTPYPTWLFLILATLFFIMHQYALKWQLMLMQIAPKMQ